MKATQITQWCARFITEQVQPGDICIDATMGNGNDTHSSLLIMSGNRPCICL